MPCAEQGWGRLCSIPCTLQLLGGTGGWLRSLSGCCCGDAAPGSLPKVGTLLGTGMEFLMQLLQVILLPW